MENSKLRVIHKSLIFDAVKEGEETYLAQVLSALEEKYKKKESWVKLMLASLSSKLGCGKTKESLEQIKNKDDSKEMEENKELKASINAGTQFLRVYFAIETVVPT